MRLCLLSSGLSYVQHCLCCPTRCHAGGQHTEHSQWGCPSWEGAAPNPFSTSLCLRGPAAPRTLQSSLKTPWIRDEEGPSGRRKEIQVQTQSCPGNAVCADHTQDGSLQPFWTRTYGPLTCCPSPQCHQVTTQTSSRPLLCRAAWS